MKFRVIPYGTRAGEPVANTVELRRMSWNDWWTYKTLFSATFVDGDGERHDIGAVKIAKLDVDYLRGDDGDGTVTPLPDEFETLVSTYVSVGQDESYYSNMRSMLGKKLRQTLAGLNDFALNSKQFAASREHMVVSRSLLRNVPATSVVGVFGRIVQGGTATMSYDFKYSRPTGTELMPIPPLELEFAVSPDSTPPTNVHVLIGRNGSGKTTILRSMVKALLGPKIAKPADGQFSTEDGGTPDIANLVYVAFSAFDVVDVPVQDNPFDYEIGYSYVGLHYVGPKDETAAPNAEPERLEAPKRTRPASDLGAEFARSAITVMREKSRDLWKAALENLESDPNFAEAEVSALAEWDTSNDPNFSKFRKEATELFQKMSSGHKIVLLTVTRLVEKVTERSLVLLDEPEGHLHPPLLSAFIRTLSTLMQTRNGLAIIATHSPVILQEVPRTCVWTVQRVSDTQTAIRPNHETFGENVGTLTNTVFNLEVTAAGFHQMLREYALQLGSYDAVVERFGNELGFEARAMLRTFFVNQEVTS